MEYFKAMDAKYDWSTVIIWHIAYDGNKYGDWWAVVRSDNKEHGGFYRLKHARHCAIDGSLHMGKFPLSEYPTGINKRYTDILAGDYFYTDTLRWFITLGECTP